MRVTLTLLNYNQSVLYYAQIFYLQILYEIGGQVKTPKVIGVEKKELILEENDEEDHLIGLKKIVARLEEFCGVKQIFNYSLLNPDVFFFDKENTRHYFAVYLNYKNQQSKFDKNKDIECDYCEQTIRQVTYKCEAPIFNLVDHHEDRDMINELWLKINKKHSGVFLAKKFGDQLRFYVSEKNPAPCLFSVCSDIDKHILFDVTDNIAKETGLTSIIDYNLYFPGREYHAPKKIYLGEEVQFFLCLINDDITLKNYKLWPIETFMGYIDTELSEICTVFNFLYKQNNYKFKDNFSNI